MFAPLKMIFWSDHANLRIRIDIDKWTKQKRVIRLDSSQLCLKGIDLGLERSDLSL